MTMFERKSVLNDALAKYDGDADVLYAFITECDTVIIEPHWECEETQPIEYLIKRSAEIADEISEGTVISICVDKRTTD